MRSLLLVLALAPPLLAAPKNKPPRLPPPASSAPASSAPASSAPPAAPEPPASASGSASLAPAPPEPDEPEPPAPAEEAEREGAAAVLWPTLTPTGDGAASGPLRGLTSQDGVLLERARVVDAVLADAAQDLGLQIDVGARAPALPRVMRDTELVAEAEGRKAWLISPRIERDGRELLLRIVAVPPGSKVVLVREERTTAAMLAVRAVVMLRDLVRTSAPARRAAPPRDEPADAPRPRRISGRSVLMAHMAIFGGYTGYALHRSSRGEDPRLLYPLTALGTGLGLGAATIVADEWNVSIGDAWYLAAGTWWSVGAAMLLSEGYGVSPPTDRYAFGLVAGIGGMGLSSIVLARKDIGEGSALLTHSGAAVGTFLGGLTELAVRGTTEETPYRGLGFGAATGLLAAGIAATQVDVSTSRVLLADLGAGLGALGGAAVASPLLKDTTPGKQRAWLSFTLAGTLVGGGLGFWLSRPAPRNSPRTAALTSLIPTPTVVPPAPGENGGARVGLAWSGSW